MTSEEKNFWIHAIESNRLYEELAKIGMRHRVDFLNLLNPFLSSIRVAEVTRSQWGRLTKPFDRDQVDTQGNIIIEKLDKGSGGIDNNEILAVLFYVFNVFDPRLRPPKIVRLPTGHIFTETRHWDDARYQRFVLKVEQQLRGFKEKIDALVLSSEPLGEVNDGGTLIVKEETLPKQPQSQSLPLASTAGGMLDALLMQASAQIGGPIHESVAARLSQFEQALLQMFTEYEKRREAELRSIRNELASLQLRAFSAEAGFRRFLQDAADARAKSPGAWLAFKRDNRELIKVITDAGTLFSEEEHPEVDAINKLFKDL